MGGCLVRSENWRDKKSSREKHAHKRTETSCIKTSSGNLFESTGNRVIAYSDRQYSGPNLLSENGGNEKFRNGLSFQTTLGTAIKKKVAAEYITSELNWHADKQSCCKTRS